MRRETYQEDNDDNDYDQYDEQEDYIKNGRGSTKLNKQKQKQNQQKEEIKSNGKGSNKLAKFLDEGQEVNRTEEDDTS